MITVPEMRILEDNAEEHGVSKAMLMERAGKAFCQELKKRYSLKGKQVLIAAYHGNNSGDGFVIARLLSAITDVTLLFIGDDTKFSEETEENFHRLPKTVRIARELSYIDNEKFHIAIDALLGTGGSGTLKEPLKSAVEFVNKQKVVASVDVPTGINPETGAKAKPFVKPNLVITFHDTKPGLKKLPVTIVTTGIGIPKLAETTVGIGDLRAAVPERDLDARKGDYGKVLIIGGSEDFSGAPALTVMALATMRSGVDLVKVVAPSRVSWAINSFTPDVITKKLKGTHITPEHIPVLEKEIDWADVVVFGPGLGRHPETEDAMAELLKTDKRKVVDADALKMTNFSSLSNAILTPHRMEFAHLWAQEFGRMAKLEKGAKLTTPQVKKLQSVLGSNIVLLKGPEDLIVSSEKTKVNATGDPGMSVGGTGDVLAGICAGFLAQGVNPFLAASAGAYLSGRAGELCRREMRFSYLASDVVKKIPVVIAQAFPQARNV